MAPHLTPVGLDLNFAEEAKGRSPKEIHGHQQKRRAKDGLRAPCLMRFRLALRGLTYKKVQEGDKGKTHACRRSLIKKARGEREVR